MSYTKLFVHLAWSTKLREPSITADIGPRVHGYLSSRCRELNCLPLAVGGVSDHIHVLVWLSPVIDVARLARELKAPTTGFIHRVLGHGDFAWQDGYGAFSLRQDEVELVRHYVDNQARHHAEGSIIDDWERTESPDPNLPQK